MFLQTHDAPDKAKRIFERLVEMFEEQNINPSPLNYYVWYQYLKGSNPQFRQEMDRILNDPFGYNDRVGRRLYDDYLSEEDKNATDFDRAFRRLIDIMIQKMNFWSEKLEQQTEELNRCTTQLTTPGLDQEQVKHITNSVLSAANNMRESNAAFQKEMKQSSEEVRQLKRQLMEARSEAMTDELTEIGNRKMFNASIEELMMDFQSNPENLCLIITDIDHFKKFNDTYGHLVGDSILRYFANIMKKHSGENETVCRYGGEEFVILMANSSLEKAAAKAEEIRHTLENTHLKRKDEDKPISTVTASFGVAVFDGKENPESFVARADKALYQAKHSGRNQVVTEIELTENEIA